MSAELTVGQAVSRTPFAAPVVRPVRERHSVLVRCSYGWLGLIIVLAVVAPLLPITDYAKPAGAARLGPGTTSFDLLLGTDSFGRSLTSRVIYGARVSLLIGTIAGLAGLVIGTGLGLLGGYRRGRVDRVISLVTDAMLAFPPLILLIALSAILTPSLTVILIGLTLVTIPNFVRLARAQAITASSREYVRAARNLGASSTRIMLREVLPNVLPALGSFLPVVVAALIVAEGSLSFLGVGIPPPRPSWGGMINDGQSALSTSPHLVLVPAAVIFLTVFSLNQIGDHLRLRFDRTLQDGS
jgi:peptide/nickel transport system permease protein